MTTRELRWALGPTPASRARRAAATMLLALARRLTRRATRPVTEPPLLEFHAEAGAPEGALYVDGRLVGQVMGVNRL